MSRILAIDYGAKRTGLAWTDPLKMIAGALPPVATVDLWVVLEKYYREEAIELTIIGLPKRFSGEDTHATPLVYSFSEEWKKKFPDREQKFWDERFTSKMAAQTLVDSGVNKTKRRDKDLINSISATILLQNYLEYLSFNPA